MGYSKFTMTKVGFFGVYSFKNGFTHKVFGLHHFLNSVDNGFCMNPWKHDDPVLIPKNVVPGLDRDFSDRDGNFVFLRCPGSDNISGSGEAAEDRKLHFPDEGNIPAASIDHITPDSLELKRFCGKFTNQSPVVILGLTNHHMAFRSLAQEFGPA